MMHVCVCVCVCFLIIVGQQKIMSEVFKKKKKRHHSNSSNDFEAPSKRIKVEVIDTADDSMVLSAPPVGLNSDTSVVESQKKKHKHQHAAGLDVDITGRGGVELNRTSTSGENNVNAVSVAHDTYMSRLEKSISQSNSHKRPKRAEQQDSPRHQHSPANSSQTIDRLYRPELRYTCVV